MTNTEASMATTSEAETCCRCGTRPTDEEWATGWPVTMGDGPVCPSCYGPEAFCSEGHTLRGDTDSGRCETCEGTATERVTATGDDIRQSTVIDLDDAREIEITLQVGGREYVGDVTFAPMPYDGRMAPVGDSVNCWIAPALLSALYAECERATGHPPSHLAGRVWFREAVDAIESAVSVALSGARW